VAWVFIKVGRKAIREHIRQGWVRDRLLAVGTLFCTHTSGIYVELRSLNRGVCIVKGDTILGVGFTKLEAWNDYERECPHDAKDLFLKGDTDCFQAISKQAVAFKRQGGILDYSNKFDGVILSPDVSLEKIKKEANSLLELIDLKGGRFKLRFALCSFDLEQAYRQPIFSLIHDEKEVSLPMATPQSSLPISAYRTLLTQSMSLMISYFIRDDDKLHDYLGQINDLFCGARPDYREAPLLHLVF